MGILSKLFMGAGTAGSNENTTILAGKYILAVDASLTILEVLKLTFKPYNCKLKTAGSGQELLALLTEASPDLVLLGMPLKDIPWSELSRMIKERYPAVPIILLKSTFAKCSKEEAEKIGIYKVIDKPFDSIMLVNEVIRAIRQSEGAKGV